jgi:hypothetical protein
LDSSASTLTALQRRLLEVYRDVEGVWLTGGGALGGFHLGHRRSHDLDGFTADVERVPELALRLRSWCASHGLACVVEQEFPGFRRLRVSDDSESTLVDLVHEPVRQVVPPSEKPLLEGVRVDPIEEIVANKLAAVLGRGETKDLVDLFALADAGVDVLASLPQAHAKDGGVDPATLAWVLASVPLDTSELLLERPLDAAAFVRFRDGLITTLQAMAWPGTDTPTS